MPCCAGAAPSRSHCGGAAPQPPWCDSPGAEDGQYAAAHNAHPRTMHLLSPGPLGSAARPRAPLRRVNMRMRVRRPS